MQEERYMDESLSQLQGQFVWSVKRGYGTYLTLEFGEPHLIVREPREVSIQSPKLVEVFSRRRVTVVGDWSLWVRDSTWSIRTHSGGVDMGADDTAIGRALGELDGQIVSSVKRERDLIFDFDLEAKLVLASSIFSAEPTSILWTLSQFGEKSISLQNNGRIVVDE